MTIELSRPVDKKLRAGVAGLEMEISDSVIMELLAAITERLDDDSEDRAASSLLMAMESVARHVDGLRVRSDSRAFSLIEELWAAYEKILAVEQDDNVRWKIASSEMKKVLDWQRQCYLELASEQSVTPDVSAPLHPAVAQLVDQQIAETGKLVEREVASLKELVGEMPSPALQKAVVDQQVSAAVAQQVSSLRDLMNQEISKLRQELQPESTRE